MSKILPSGSVGTSTHPLCEHLLTALLCCEEPGLLLASLLDLTLLKHGDAHTQLWSFLASLPHKFCLGV